MADRQTCDNCNPEYVNPCDVTQNIRSSTQHVCRESGECCDAPPSAIKFDLIIDDDTWVNANSNSSIDFSWIFGGDGSGGVSAPDTCYRELLGVFLTTSTWNFADFMTALETFAQTYNPLSSVSGNVLTILIPITRYLGPSESWNTFCGCDENEYWTPLTNFTDVTGNIDYTFTIECCDDCNSTVNEDYTIIDVDVSNYINTNRVSWTLQFIEFCDGVTPSVLFEYAYPGGNITIPAIIYNLLNSPTAAWIALEALGAYWIYDNINNPNSFRLVIPRNADCCENSGVPESWLLAFSVVPPGESVGIESIETTTCCDECLSISLDADNNIIFQNCSQCLGYTISEVASPSPSTIVENACSVSLSDLVAGYYNYEVEYYNSCCETPTDVYYLYPEFFVFPDCDYCYVGITLLFDTDIESYVGDLTFEFSNLSSGFDDITLTGLNSDTISDITDLLDAAASGFFTEVVKQSNYSTFFGPFPCEFCPGSDSGRISSSIAINQFTTAKITVRCANSLPYVMDPGQTFVNSLPFTINWN